MARGRHERSLAALVPTQYQPGESGNKGGRPATKPITDGMRLLLAGDKDAFLKLPRTLQLIIGRWYGQAWSDPRGMALLLERIEGRVMDAPERPLPTISFVEQHFGPVHVHGAKTPPRVIDAQPSAENGNGHPH